MREILFRGKHTDTGKWVEGLLITVELDTYSEVEKAKYTHCIVEPKAEMYRGELCGFDFVEPETVGQYTGLTDKNGKKIFEGDIVAFYFFDKGNKNTRTMLIEWIESGFCMKELFRDYQLAKDFSIITGKFDTYRGEIKQGVYISNNTYFVEVIGNIHDNPELLK